MKIEDISIFGEYKQTENRVTAAYLQICKVGGEPFIRYVANRLQIILPDNEIHIHSQVKDDGSVPDGLLESSFSFKLFVESKIAVKSININQLNNHLLKITSPNSFLLYLTPDSEKPVELGNTYWANWKTISSIFNDYIVDPKVENFELLDFLIRHFETLLSNLNLLNYGWDLSNNKVLIVAGSWAEGVALKYNFYICQDKRSFKPAKYISFYMGNKISYVFEIIKPPEDGVNLKNSEEFKLYLETGELDYSGESRKVFRLKFYKELQPVINDSLDKNGKPCPYTYGQPRYTEIETLMKASKTSEL